MKVWLIASSWRGYAVFGHPNPDDTSSRHHLSRAPTQQFNGHQTRLEPGAGAVEEAHHVEQEDSAQDGDDEAPEVESGDAGATQGADDQAADHSPDNPDYSCAEHPLSQPPHPA